MESQKKLQIACFGYNGYNNTGSEAKLLTTLNTINDVMGDRIDEITVITFNTKNQKRYLKDHPNIRLIEVGPWILFKNPKLLFDKGADIFFLVEGSTFIDHFSSLFLWMFCGAAELEKFHGHKVIAYANDCGHLKPSNQQRLRKTADKLDLILLRNSDAAARMKEYGVTQDITVTADGAYEYPMPSKQYQDKLFKKIGLNPQGRPIFGIAPKEFFWWPVGFKPWGPKDDLYRYPFYHTWRAGGKESSKRYIQQTAKHADWCIETYDAEIVLISMEHMDYQPTKKIFDHMKHKNRATIVSSDEYVADDIISVLSTLTALFTTRYHAIVLSSCSAVPVVAISSDTRCESVFQELDMMELYIDYVKHPNSIPNVLNLDEHLIAMTKTLMSEHAKLKQKIADAHPIFVERAQQNGVVLKKWFEENFPPPDKQPDPRENAIAPQSS